MARDRHQNGWVELVGKQVKKWRGHYYIYERQVDGSEIRRHKTVTLGLKAQMRKHEAQAKLCSCIAKVTGAHVTASPECTLEWFWENRFLPMHHDTWKESSRKETIANIRRYVIAQVGTLPLKDIDKFTLQQAVNGLSQKYSKSVVDKFMVWSKAILDEAVDQELLTKNPARKLDMPQVRKVSKRVATISEIGAIFSCMEQPIRLMLTICLVLALRPGELLALRWDDVGEQSLRIDEGTRYGKVYDPKTDASAAAVWLPTDIRTELEAWRALSLRPGATDLVFPSPRGRIIRLDNFRKRSLAPALAVATQSAQARRLLAEGDDLNSITFQVCRRTCATFMQQHGGVKDIQAHLRHAQVSTTLGVYVQQIPESVRSAVNSLYRALCGATAAAPAVIN